jgi:hypothetical protein
MRRTALLMFAAAMVLLSAGGVNPAEVGRCGGPGTGAHEFSWTC